MWHSQKKTFVELLFIHKHYLKVIEFWKLCTHGNIYLQIVSLFLIVIPLPQLVKDISPNTHAFNRNRTTKQKNTKRSKTSKDRALSYFVKMFGLSQYRIPIKIFTTISNFHAFDFRAPERFKYLRPVDLRARRFNLRAA